MALLDTVVLYNVTVIWWWMWWIKILILKLLRMIFWEYVRDREYEPVEVRSDDDSDGKNICSNWTLPSFKR